MRSDIALDKQKGCKVANHPDIMLELQREKAASMQLVLLKEQLSNIYSNITITGRRSLTNCLFGPHSYPDMFSGPGGSCTFMRLHSRKVLRHASVNHQLQNDKCNLWSRNVGTDWRVKQQRLVNRVPRFLLSAWSHITPPDRRRNSWFLILGGLHFISVIVLDSDGNWRAAEENKWGVNKR